MNGRIFYGWYVVLVAALGVCFGYVGTLVYAFSSFILPLTNEYGWSRGAISLGLSISNTTMLLSAPIVGALSDRIGVRRVLIPSTILFGIGLCFFYFLTQNIWHFYVSIFLLTALGSGTASVAYVRLLVNWFDRKKGLALALGTSGAGVAAIILPPLVAWIIAETSWREAYLSLGLINLLVVLPLICLIIRNRPADIGSQPDGVQRTATGAGEAGIYHEGYTFRESIRLPAFWKLAAATLLLGMTLTGAVSQLIPLLVDRGIARESAASLASLLGLSVISSRLIAGYLLDRFHAPFIAAGFLALPVIGFASVAVAPGELTAVLVIISIGTGLGLEFDALGYFSAQYFGRRSVGRIYGILFVIFNIGGATGVFLAGHSYDVFSSYYVALVSASIATLLAIGITVSLGPYPDLRARTVRAEVS